VNISTKFYLENKESLVIHNELLLTLKVVVKGGKVSNLICEKIKSI
jgi:hypothetical protein